VEDSQLRTQYGIAFWLFSLREPLAQELYDFLQGPCGQTTFVR